MASLYALGYKEGDLLCAGVSGGADSICLLTSVVQAQTQDLQSARLQDSSSTPERCQLVNVITINHRIRSESESMGDALYVKEYSQSLNCPCTIISLEPGEVEQCAKFRGRGTEDAARFLRYKAFNDFCLDLMKKNKTRKIFFALAHNQNDQLETLVMRFLQGAGLSSREGIASRRDQILKSEDDDEYIVHYVRPLLDISREDIERYLKIQGIKWRTDSTNSETEYLRNKIRSFVIPALDKTMAGWKNAVLAGREKALIENNFLEKTCAPYQWKNCGGKDCGARAEDAGQESGGENDGACGIENDGVYIEAETFLKLEDAQKIRLLYRAFEKLSLEERVPFLFVKQVLCKIQHEKIINGQIEAYIKDGFLFVKKCKNSRTVCGFFAIINKECSIDFDFGVLKATKPDKAGFTDLEFVTKAGKCFYLNKIHTPFCFRSRQIGDNVLTKQRDYKTVADVLSDFKVDSEHKDLIPVIQSLEDDKKILAVWGSIFGFKDWIV